MAEDICLNKTQIIRRCLDRIRTEYTGDPCRLEDWTRQDAIVLNLLRACEVAIDLAMQEVARRRLGLPQTSREAFGLLEQARVLAPELARRMQAMVGFRNVALPSYQEMQPAILRRILDERLNDSASFAEAVLTCDS